MTKTKISTTTYKLSNGFYIDIVKTKTNYEAYIYNDRYGIKSLIVGASRKHLSTGKFIAMVKNNNIEDQIDFYRRQFMGFDEVI